MLIDLHLSSGTVSLWSPSVSKPQVQLQAHRGPVTSISLDPSTLGTRMVTTGLDGAVKIWDTRKWAVLNEYHFKKTPSSVSFSQKGMLGLGWGNHISVRVFLDFRRFLATPSDISPDNRYSTILLSLAKIHELPLHLI